MRPVILLTFLSLLLASCEDVIDVELNDARPRLVIESNINVSMEEGVPINNFIRLTTTAPFFQDSIPIVSNATVMVKDTDGTVFPFEYLENGFYYSNFIPIQNMEYTLEVIYGAEIFTATTQLVPTSRLEYVSQRNDGGFSGDQIELKAYFMDIPGKENFYFLSAASERGVSRAVYSDKFFEGNYMFGTYRADDLTQGDLVQFNLFGISEQYYNYMFVLLQQTGSGGGPFETQPATVKGNIINETTPENYPLGYFRMSEISKLNYVVE